MNRRRSKRSALSLFQWLFKSIAIVLGIVSLPPRTRRIAMKRCGTTAPRSNKGVARHPRLKSSRIKETVIYPHGGFRSVVDFNNECEPSTIQVSSSNNNRGLTFEDYARRILCFQVDNDQIAERIQSLLANNASVLKHTRVVDLQELVTLIRSTAVHSKQEDASTMTTLDQNGSERTSCLGFMSQSVDARRLKALEFIHVFLAKSKDEFCRYLTDDEHLCQRKTLAIYQMIRQFLDIVSHTEHERK